jgi:hypothetical protein
VIFAHGCIKTQTATRAIRVREKFNLRETRRARPAKRVFIQDFSAKRALGGEKEVNQSAPERTHAYIFTGYV